MDFTYYPTVKGRLLDAQEQHARAKADVEALAVRLGLGLGLRKLPYKIARFTAKGPLTYAKIRQLRVGNKIAKIIIMEPP